MLFRFVRAFLRASVRIYFKRIDVSGRENVPETGPAILVANHPNSVIDAFLIGTQLSRRTINFIAKDSIPNAPVLGSILRRCGVIGVARLIDYTGDIRQTHGKNLKAIDTCVPHLEAGEIMSIFGEGVSTDSRKLGIIKKGAVRIAYNAEEPNDFRLGVALVPIGINYSAKERFRSSVLISVGEPFRITDFGTQLAQNKQKVLLRGTRRLQESIEHLIVNIVDDQLAPLVEQITDIYARPPGQQAGDQNLVEYYREKRRITECIQYLNQTEPKLLEHIRQSIDTYWTLLRRMHLDDETITRRVNVRALIETMLKTVVGLIGLTLSFYGWVNNVLPRYLGKFARRFGRSRHRTVRPDGQTTERIVIARETAAAHWGGWMGALIAYPLQTFALGSIVVSVSNLVTGIVAGSLYVVTLVPSWKFSLEQTERVRQRISDIRVQFAALTHRLFIVRIRRRRAQAVKMIHTTLSSFDALHPS